MGPRFVVIDGLIAGHVFSLEGDRKTIGRGPMNEINVPYMKISHRLCLLKSLRGQFAIPGLGSLNGTLVNAVKINTARVLKDGDEVRLGDTKLMFCTDEPAPQLPGEPAESLQNLELIPSESRYLKT